MHIMLYITEQALPYTSLTHIQTTAHYTVRITHCRVGSMNYTVKFINANSYTTEHGIHTTEHGLRIAQQVSMQYYCILSAQFICN